MIVGGDTHDKEVGNTVQVRRKHCPAFEKKCEKCSRLGHYTKLCKSKSRDDKSDAKNVKTASESAAGVVEHLLGVSLGEVGTPNGTPQHQPKPVMRNGTPNGTPQLRPQLQPRSNLVPTETAVDHQQVRVQQAGSDGYVPHRAVVDVHEADNQVGDSYALPPVTTTSVVVTPAVGDQVPHQHHAAGSPRRDQVPRSRSPGLERSGSLEPVLVILLNRSRPL